MRVRESSGGDSDQQQLMLNVLTIDVEDYFHVEAFATRVSKASWGTFASRVEQNSYRALELFGRHQARATFFVLGWVAERFPNLVRQIASAGHEVGCHGLAHEAILRQTPAEFREDVRAARQCLMDQVQMPVISYRAPSFSIVNRTLWALDILAEEGFQFDSSIFPVRHDFYGIPDAPRHPYRHTTAQGRILFEFPPSTVRFAGMNWGIGGGGWLRFVPYGFTRWAIRRLNSRERQPAMVYFHPWELDPEQPRIKSGVKSRLRHYTNLSGMERKIERLLEDFEFSPISDVCTRMGQGLNHGVTENCRGYQQ
jgi:polysaccharide deacetylase family protein (PEP-CTERM system associated)